MPAIKCLQCGLINFETATQCKRCGTLFAQNVSTTGENIQGFVTADGYVLPAPPSVGTPNAGIWREGKTLVVSRDATLPLRCVKCNVFTHERLKRNYAWHHPAIYALLLVAWLIYLIVAMIVRKRATLELGLCENHQTKRRYGIMATVALIVLAFAGFILAVNVDDGTPAVIGFLMLIASVVVGFRMARVGYPKKIDDRYVWLRGFNSDYVAEFPAWPGV